MDTGHQARANRICKIEADVVHREKTRDTIVAKPTVITLNAVINANATEWWHLLYNDVSIVTGSLDNIQCFHKERTHKRQDHRQPLPMRQNGKDQCCKSGQEQYPVYKFSRGTCCHMVKNFRKNTTYNFPNNPYLENFF